MVHYCINTIICSGLLLFLYKALLENEKMHSFKRFYLLFSIILSLLAPLITISFSSSFTASEFQYIPVEASNAILIEQTATAPNNFNLLASILIVIYISGCSIALFQFTCRLRYFFKMSKKGEAISLNGAKLVLIDQNIAPHSFLNNIFVNATAYKNKQIEKEIIAHELTHVNQHHSLDILFAQLIQCLYWFNPFLIGYTKAIQLNHEFLADEAVIRSSKNPVLYQYLLINSASMKSRFSLASQFNYSIIKKRLIMIAKTSSRQKLVIKGLVTIFLFAGAGLLFVSKKTVAQVAAPQIQNKEVPSTKQGASPQMVNEYEAIVDRYRTADAQGNTRFRNVPNISEQEKKRLWEIYQMMTKESIILNNK